MIDNTEKIKPLLVFPSADNFYFLQILQRKKDHKGKAIGGSNNNSRLVRAYYIKSLEHLDAMMEEIKVLCDALGARASINLNPRSFEKASFQTLQKMANQMMNKDFENTYRAWNTVCGEYHAEIDKRWIVDLDGPQIYLLPEIIEHIKIKQAQLQSHEKAGRYKILASIPSKSGIHLITNPFDVTDWNEIGGYSKIEIHKNNPTNLYIPDGI